MAFDVGAVTASITLDPSQFQAGIAAAQKSVSGMGSSVSAGLGQVNAMFGTTNESAQQAAQMFTMGDTAAKTYGQSTTALAGAQGGLSSALSTGAGSFLKQAAAMAVGMAGIQSLQAALSTVIGVIRNAVESIDAMDQAVLDVASRMMNMNPGMTFQQAEVQARAFLETATMLGAQIGVDAAEVQQFVRGMQLFGISADLASESGQHAFQVVLAAMKTAGGQMDLGNRSLRTFAALMGEQVTVAGGMAGAFTPLITELKAIDPMLTTHVQLWKQEGTILEHIAGLLPGATAELDRQKALLSSIRSDAEYTANAVLRNAFMPAIQEIAAGVQATTGMFRDQNGLTEAGKETVIAIRTAWEAVSVVLGGIWKVLQPIFTLIGPVLKVIELAVQGLVEGLTFLEGFWSKLQSGAGFGAALAAGADAATTEFEKMNTQLDLVHQNASQAALSAGQLHENLIQTADGAKALYGAGLIDLKAYIAALQSAADAIVVTDEKTLTEKTKYLDEIKKLQDQETQKAEETAKAIASADAEIAQAEQRTLDARLATVKAHYEEVLKATHDEGLAEQVQASQTAEAYKQAWETRDKVVQSVLGDVEKVSKDQFLSEINRIQEEATTRERAIADAVTATSGLVLTTSQAQQLMGAEAKVRAQQFAEAYVTAFDALKKNLTTLEQQHNDTLNAMGDNEVKLAALRTEVAHGTADQVLAAEQTTLQKVADSTGLSTQQRIQKEEELQKIIEQRITAAEKEGTGTGALQAALNASRQDEITLLEKVTAEQQTQADEQDKAITKAQADLDAFQKKYGAVFGGLAQAASTSAKEVYQILAVDLPASMLSEWTTAANRLHALITEAMDPKAHHSPSALDQLQAGMDEARKMVEASAGGMSDAGLPAAALAAAGAAPAAGSMIVQGDVVLPPWPSWVDSPEAARRFVIQTVNQQASMQGRRLSGAAAQ